MGGARRHTPAARRLRPRRRVPAGRRKEAIGTHTGRTRATPQCRGAPDSASTDKITAHMRARRMCLPTAEARLAGDTRAAADLSAWLVVEDESGQGLRPPKGRSWGRRGRTPVVHVTAANAPRLSVAALVAVKPGVRPRLIYRTRRGRRASRRKGFTEADYAALLDAAHRQLGGPIVGVWDKCAVWRFAASPTHSGGIWRNIPGSPDSPGGESRRGQQHVRKAVVAPKAFRATRREARAIWPRLDCLKPNLQGCKEPPVGMTPDTDAALCSAMVVPAGQPPQRRTPPNEGDQEDE